MVTVLAFSVATAARADSPTLGAFVSGEAVPVAAVTDQRFLHLSFELERCGRLVRTTWYDANHVLLATDELEATDGKLDRYRYWRPNVDDFASVVRDGQVLRIDRTTDGHASHVELQVTGEVAVGPMIVLAAEREFRQLLSGQHLNFNYAVPEQLASYDFTVSKVAAEGEQHEMEVSPASWLIRPFVRPVTLYFDQDGAFAGLRGRALPVTGSPSHPQPLEVEAHVLRRETRSCSPLPDDQGFARLVQLSGAGSSLPSDR